MRCDCCNTCMSENESTNIEFSNCSCLQKVNHTTKSSLSFKGVNNCLSKAKVSDANKTQGKNKRIIKSKTKSKNKLTSKKTATNKNTTKKTDLIVKNPDPKNTNKSSNLDLSELNQLTGISTISDCSFIGKLYQFDHSTKQRTVLCYCSSNIGFNINDLVESFIDPGDLHQYSSFLEGFGTINFRNKVFYAIFKPFAKSSEENFCRSLNEKYANGGLVKNCQGVSFYLRTKMMQPKYVKLTLYPIPCDVKQDFIVKMVKDGDWGTCTNVKYYGSFNCSWKNCLVEVTLKNFNKDCIPPFILLNNKKVFISLYEQNDKLWKEYEKNVKDLQKQNYTNNENTTTKIPTTKLHNLSKKPSLKNECLKKCKSKKFSSTQIVNQSCSSLKFFNLNKNFKSLKKKKSHDVLQSLIKAVSALQKPLTIKKNISGSSLIKKLMEKIKEVKTVSSTNLLKNNNSMKKCDEIIKDLDFQSSSTHNNYKSLKYYMRNTKPKVNNLNLCENSNKVYKTDSDMKVQLFKRPKKNNKVTKSSKLSFYKNDFIGSSLSKIARQLCIDQPKEGASPNTKHTSESTLEVSKKLEEIRRKLNIPAYTNDIKCKKIKRSKHLL